MRRGCPVLVLGALIAAGCGSQAKTVSHTPATTASTSPATTSTTTTPTGAAAAPGDCNTLGINPTGMREGTCTHAGITYVIVDQNHTLKLHTLWAKLNGIRNTTGTTAQGKSVVATITITNRLELPQTFDGSGTQQAGLILEGTVYKEDMSAESTADPAACLSQHVRILPHQSKTCDVIFQVANSAVADIGKHGSGDLYIVEFGSSLAGSISPQTVGQIRLYR